VNADLEERMMLALTSRSSDSRIHDMQRVIIDLRRELAMIEETTEPYVKDWIWNVRYHLEYAQSEIVIECFRSKWMYIRVPINRESVMFADGWHVLENIIVVASIHFQAHILEETRKMQG